MCGKQRTRVVYVAKNYVLSGSKVVCVCAYILKSLTIVWMILQCINWYAEGK